MFIAVYEWIISYLYISILITVYISVTSMFNVFLSQNEDVKKLYNVHIRDIKMYVDPYHLCSAGSSIRLYVILFHCLR